MRPATNMRLRLDEDAFRQRFRKSPIKRTKRRGLLRNVCIAMGNSGNAEFVDDLMRVSDDGEPLIRGHAAWALGRLASIQRGTDIAGFLGRCALTEKNNEVLKEIARTIHESP